MFKHQGIKDKKTERKIGRRKLGEKPSFLVRLNILRLTHGTSGVGASFGGKSVAALYGLLEHSTLHVEVGIAATATLSFITSSVSIMPGMALERCGAFDSVYWSPLRSLYSGFFFFFFRDPLIMTTVFFASDGRLLKLIYVPMPWADHERLIDHLAPLVLFSQLCSMDYDQLLVEFNVGAARQTCLSSKVRLLLEHDLRDKKSGAGSATGRLEQNSALDEEKSVLVGKVAALESANTTKMTELASLTAQTAKLTQDLSELDLSCDELSVKVSSPEAERDKLIGQVSLLEGTCSKLRDEVSGYLAALRGAIGRVIDKGMQDRLVAGIDHGKAGRGLADVAAYDPFVEANYVSAVNALRAMDFLLLAQLESQKDASIADIMGLLHLEGPTAEAPEASHLKPSPEQLMLPIHRLEDQVVIGETSFSFLPVPASDHEVVDTQPHAGASSSPKIISEQETLETSPEHPAT
ncbi:hypothetical protein Tco_1440159 [Tanacetum coccineum]